MNATHLFTYSARQLRVPLRRLITYLDKRIDKSAPAVAEAAKLVVKRTSLAAPASDIEVMAQRTVQQANHDKHDRAKAALWLAEAERLWPWHKFSLDESELKWLHRYRAEESI